MKHLFAHVSAETIFICAVMFAVWWTLRSFTHPHHQTPRSAYDRLQRYRREHTRW